MTKKMNGGARRGGLKLARLATKLVFELLVGTLLLVALVVIEGCGHLAVQWLVEQVGNHWLTAVVEVVEDLVVLADAVCYVWTVLKSIWAFMKEVR